MRSLCSSQWRGIPSGSADEIFRRAAGSGRGSAAGGGGGPGPAGEWRRDAVRCGPSPSGRRGLGEPQSLETSEGGAGGQGPGSKAEGRGWGDRGGVGAGPQLA